MHRLGRDHRLVSHAILAVGAAIVIGALYLAIHRYGHSGEKNHGRAYAPEAPTRSALEKKLRASAEVASPEEAENMASAISNPPHKTYNGAEEDVYHRLEGPAPQ